MGLPLPPGRQCQPLQAPISPTTHLQVVEEGLRLLQVGKADCTRACVRARAGGGGGDGFSDQLLPALPPPPLLLLQLTGHGREQARGAGGGEGQRLVDRQELLRHTRHSRNVAAPGSQVVEGGG